MPVPTPNKPINVGSRSTRFHVPDDDEIDSSSESSREPSVEILNSHIRAYSVPSSEESVSTSDDEEDPSPSKEVRLCESTNKSGIVAKPGNTAGTASHHALEIWTESPSSKKPDETESFSSSNIKLNETGTPHLCSFALMETHEKIVLDIDSEDEQPEVLSSKKTQVCSATDVPTSSGTQGADSQCLPGTSPFVAPEADHVMVDRGTLNNHENPEKSTTEVQPLSPEIQMDDSSLKKSTRRPLHELVTIEENMDCDSLYFPYCDQPTPSALPGYNYTSPDCKISGPAPTVLYLASEKSIPEDSQTTSMNGSDYSHLAANRKTTTRNVGKDSAQKACVTRRPPSPSDAALVKKGKFVDQRSFWPVMEQTQGQSLIDNPSEYHTQFNQAHGMGETDPTHSDFMKEGRYYGSFDSSSWTFPHLQSVDRSQIHGSTTEPVTLSLSGAASSKSIAQGRPLETTLLSSCIPDSYVENCTSLGLNVNPDPSILGVLHHQAKENGSHSSRVNISDIVHPQLESTRNLKRKAHEMSADDDAEAEADEESRVLPSESSQDVLTDAQPRDIASGEETALLEDSSNMSDEIATTVQQSLVSDSAGPPRKKVKTSVSTAIGIGKFVSGVCVGVVGAFAAFIATIPLSVQEEAMQELVSSA